MTQISMTVRMDSQLKKLFDKLCAEFGMSANTAMNIFAKAVVQRRKIPFEIRADKETSYIDPMLAFQEMRRRAEAGETPELSLEEINDEISKARSGR
ncbi:MAG: type II toxin-antitoxin system RelB/DinJ family antitoxin [Bacteroidales bacterium]|nr:type II toxin-antitoxin system RelB/DinJ family antitoxin [Bacteroidales bacterium]